MMAGTIYANARFHDRDLAIAAARASQSADEVANQFNLAAATIRAVCRRLKAERTYHIYLEGQAGERQPVAVVVTHKGFTAACVAAYREYLEYFRNLGCPGWRLTDGTSYNTLETVAIMCEFPIVMNDYLQIVGFVFAPDLPHAGNRNCVEILSCCISSIFNRSSGRDASLYRRCFEHKCAWRPATRPIVCGIAFNRVEQEVQS